MEVILVIFLRISFWKNADFGAFWGWRNGWNAAGRIQYTLFEHFYMFAKLHIVHSQHLWVWLWQLQNLGVNVHTPTSRKNLNECKNIAHVPHSPSTVDNGSKSSEANLGMFSMFRGPHMTTSINCCNMPSCRIIIQVINKKSVLCCVCEDSRVPRSLGTLLVMYWGLHIS